MGEAKRSVVVGEGVLEGGECVVAGELGYQLLLRVRVSLSTTHLKWVSRKAMVGFAGFVEYHGGFLEEGGGRPVGSREMLA